MRIADVLVERGVVDPAVVGSVRAVVVVGVDPVVQGEENYCEPMRPH